jgi:hypothetical protein
MTGRLRLVAWATFGLTIAGMAGNGILVVVGRTLPAQIVDWATLVAVLLMIISLAIAGLLISLRFPGTAIGWIHFACLEPLRHAVSTSRVTVIGGYGALGGRLERAADGIAGSIPVHVEVVVT